MHQDRPRRCRTCNQYLDWLLTNTYRRLPFDFRLLPVDQVPVDRAWVAYRQHPGPRAKVLLVPLANADQQIRTSAQYVAVLHDECGQYADMIDRALNRIRS